MCCLADLVIRTEQQHGRSLPCWMSWQTSALVTSSWQDGHHAAACWLSAGKLKYTNQPGMQTCQALGRNVKAKGALRDLVSIKTATLDVECT